MAVNPQPRQSIEQAQRVFFENQAPVPSDSGAVNAVTVANQSIVEVPYAGRNFGAVQIYSTDGAAFTATFKVQGTLLGGSVASDPNNNYASMWTVNSTDTDYVDITGLTALSAGGIYQIPANNAFSRIRVICTAYTSGHPGVRVL